MVFILNLLADRLEKVFSTNSWNSQWELFRLSRHWEEVVGQTLAQVTEPAYFRKGTLYIYVENSAWMQQLQFLKLELLGKFNEKLARQQLTDIRFFLRPSTDHKKEMIRQEPPLKKVDPDKYQKFKAMAGGVREEASRKALIKLWKFFEQQSR